MADDVEEMLGAWTEACRIEEDALRLLLNCQTLNEAIVLGPLLEFASRTRRELWVRLMLAYLNPPQPKFPAWCDA